MITTNSFEVTRTSTDRTEDGDYIYNYRVTAHGFSGIRDFNATRRYPVLEWVGKGNGVFEGTYSDFVDATEVAIERSNDYHAWLRGDDRDY